MEGAISKVISNKSIKTTLRIVYAGWVLDLKKYGMRPSELARALRFCQDKEYILETDDGYKLTKSGLAWLKEHSPDPSFIWVDVPKRMMVAKGRRDTLSSLGRRARGAIRRRVSDHATKVADPRDS